MRLEFNTLSHSSNVSGFDCGIDELNDFLLRLSLIYQERRFGFTILCHQYEDLVQRVIGYYTIAPAQAFRSELPDKIFTGRPRPNPIPAFRLCRLAIDKAFQRKGIGEIVLFNALKKCYEASGIFGGALIIVDAKNENARDFYVQYGFQPLPINPLCLVMSLKTLAKYL
ncbi:MAG: GNAT family N-acetyltransferase [Parachlamydiaceae bacterium]|nr:GNAT family N-acetyltransferase [Parachlamydiaceae bacterium]